ncbi:hypothetical protein CWI37_0612p0020 [Hamiltosporidium tvaerminnensis]|uniref:Uncharacterized protein n=1 Tax=Hamiltosporidium tvaerminnensis TaxID=1176355 RepID=A0A4Q9L313_9MICR|nr:hypothetical protein CWI37_0612p0020 [Hamiltosporidium tvaerminnensis]
MSFLYFVVRTTKINPITSSSSFDTCYKQQCGIMVDDMLFRVNKPRFEDLDNHRDNYCNEIKDKSEIGRKEKEICNKRQV